jgi:AcrR family transcriptional regulator
VNLRVIQKEETRARILESAIELFLGSDTDDITIKDIAERAGISTPSVFFHFGTRVELLKAVGEELLRRAEAAMPQPGTVPGTFEALQNISARVRLGRPRTQSAANLAPSSAR